MRGVGVGTIRGDDEEALVSQTTNSTSSRSLEGQSGNTHEAVGTMGHSEEGSSLS